jgi:uncharacterized protein YdeI (YjbR/CyaY-like superfamily)
MAQTYHVSEDSFKEKTGRTSAEWKQILDNWGAAHIPHPQIAKYLESEHKVPSWWAQSITVKYEYDIGRRSQEVTIPPELAAALGAHPQAKTVFEKLSPGHQREHINYINEAKQIETKHRRVTKAIQSLLTDN